MEYVFCETIAAIVWHIRVLGPAGAKYGGGADTLALCGADPAWDLRVEINERTLTQPEMGESGRICKTCCEKYKEATDAHEG